MTPPEQPHDEPKWIDAATGDELPPPDPAMPPPTDLPEPAPLPTDPAMAAPAFMEMQPPEAPQAPEMPEPGEETAAATPPAEPGPPPAPEHKTVFYVDPNDVEFHPLADLLPAPSESGYRRLKESIAIDGQQAPAVRFEGMLLDGRTRCRVCRELRILVKVEDFQGTEAQALTHVLSVNQYQRELDKSQRAAVAARLLPRLTDPVNQERIAKISAYRRGVQIETRELFPGSENTPEPEVRARVIAAQRMGVNDRYVADAARLQHEAPELFAEVWAGKRTITDAMRQLTGQTDDATTAVVRTTRTRLNRFLRRLDEHPDFLDRLNHFMDEYESALP